MAGQGLIQRGYAVTVSHPGEGEGPYRVSYAQRSLQNGDRQGGNGEAKDFLASVLFRDEGVSVTWEAPPVGPEVSREAFEQDARDRVSLLRDWMTRLRALVTTVEQYATELGWATRRIDKKMEDSQIGKHEAPALLLQEGAHRVLLEPVGRSAPGVEGVVDLYLMPAYDDIASLYYYDGRWNLHYIFPGTTGAATTREAPAKPLTRDTLREVLDQMKKDAA